jgi:hypothetical protein
VASVSDSTVASVSDSQDGAGAAAAAAAAAAGKQKSTDMKGHEYTFFCYSMFDEPDANMMLRGIDLKPEPIQEKKIELKFCDDNSISFSKFFITLVTLQ